MVKYKLLVQILNYGILDTKQMQTQRPQPNKQFRTKQNISHRCFLEQETLPLLLITGWFKERIRAWFHNRTKINWGSYGRLP